MTDQGIAEDRAVPPDADLFAERAAPPAVKHVLGIIAFVLACVAVLSVVAYLIGSGTD